MDNSLRWPTFTQYFCSFYYENENNFLPPVDLSEETLRTNGDLVQRPDIEEVIQRPAVQKILSSPIPIDAEARERNVEILQSNGLVTGQCQLRSNCHCSIKKPEIGVKLLPSMCFGFSPCISDRGEHNLLSPEDGLLSLEMSRHIQRVADAQKIKVQTVTDKLLLFNSSQEEVPSKKYCVLAGVWPVLEPKETINCIKGMSQEEQIDCARKLCLLIQKAGIVEANFSRIVLTKEDHTFSFAVSPHGLLVSKQSELTRGASIEKCGRIGLSYLRYAVRKSFGETLAEGSAFRGEVEKAYQEAMRPKWSKWKITLSVMSLGLIPLIYAIISLVQVRVIQSRVEQVKELNQSLQAQASSTSKQQTELKEKIRDLWLSIFSMAEGIPFIDFNQFRKQHDFIDF